MNWHLTENRWTGRLLTLGGIFSVAGAWLSWSSGQPLLSGVAMLAAGGIATIAALRAVELWLLLRRQRLVATQVFAQQALELPTADVASGDLVEQMLRRGRYALLLRPQIAEQLLTEQFCHALETLQTEMALVPGGEVTVKDFDQVCDALQTGNRSTSTEECIVPVEQYFLDRHAVTNQQYWQFVQAGGYEQSALWTEEMLPILRELVDVTGQPGPSSWSNGRYPASRPLKYSQFPRG